MAEARLIPDAPGARLELTGDGSSPTAVHLEGQRARVSAIVSALEPTRASADRTTWRAILPLRDSRWGAPELPLPSGEYRVRIEGGDAASVGLEGAQAMVQYGTLRASLGDGVVTVGPPLDPAYDSGEGQEALQRRYAARRDQLENAVFFESSGGHRAGGDPFAIDRELARQHPEVARYWSVADLSIAVPDGAVAVVDGSPQWWRARGAAQLLVVDDWLRRRFVRRPGQHVLQTWHGTPIEQIGLRRPGTDWRRWAAVLGESRRWNALLAQSPYAAHVLGTAHAFHRRPIWVEGSPRNDALVSPGASDLREMLGIDAEETVLLLAPARRRRGEPPRDIVDPWALSAAVGAVVLSRGPAAAARTSTEAGAASGRVVDITTYPHTSDLLRVADALVTDYAPAMFDFSVTGKPMYFLVPDLEQRRGVMGGFSVDLVGTAPGPVVRTQAALERAIVETDPTAYAQVYDSWRKTHNARDDGGASARVVARLVNEGFLTPQ